MPERPKGPRGKSLVTKRSIRLYGHKTSVTLESAFWTALTIAAVEGRRSGPAWERAGISVTSGGLGLWH